MMVKIRCVFLTENDKMQVEFNEPNQCPICKKSIKPYFISGRLNRDKKTAYALFECRACYGGFIKCMSGVTIHPNSGITYVESAPSKSYIAPNPPQQVEFSEYITQISTKFIEIYNQANAAECHNLNEIAGIGYRKAAEFLIKDYLISITTDEDKKEKIKAAFLSKCIGEYVANDNIKIVATRIAWLGNDEAHYLRKHTDRDVTYLKQLIDVAVRWIEAECITREAEEIQPIK